MYIEQNYATVIRVNDLCRLANQSKYQFIHDATNRFDDVETTSTFYHLPHVIQLTGSLEDVPRAITTHFATGVSPSGAVIG